ncbi:PAS domain S-box protein [Myxococcota bacterium]|nr:PAS domain S-box protein [Myxococcota bacterium]
MSVEGKTSGGDGSESWFRGVADSISDLLSVFDGEGRFLYANPAWQSTMGYSPTSLVGRHRVELIHPEDAPRYRRHAEMATTLGGLPLDELQVRHRDGTWRVMESSGRLLRDERGRPLREVLIWRDITERRRAEMLLLDQKRALEAMASGAPLEEVLHTIARLPESRLEGVFCAVFGRDHAAGKLRLLSAPTLPTALATALAELPLDAGYESWGSGGFPVSTFPGASLPRAVMRVREAAMISGVQSSWSWPIRRGREEAVGTLALYATHTMPLSAETKHVAETAVALAMTALSASQAVAESSAANERLINALNASPLMAIEWDREGKVRFWSTLAERNLGWRAQDAIGRPLRELGVFAKEDEDLVPRALEGLLARGERVGMVSARVVGPDGRPRAGEWYLSAQPDERGGVGSALALVVDVSQRRTTDEAGARAEKLTSLSRLAEAVATRLGGALGQSLQALDESRARLSGDPSAVALIDQAIDPLRQGEALCSRLLAYSGASVNPPRAVSLNEVVREMISTLTAQVPRKVGLDYYLEPELPAVEGDREQLRQVLAELVHNAAEALGDSPGSIRVSTDVITIDDDDLAEIRCASSLSVGEYVMLEVTDSGPGFDGASAGMVFDPFFTTKPGHVGLGLAAVEGVARAMGGGVRAEGGAGEGATVQVILPLGRAKAVAPTPQTASPARRGTVLVAEDEAETRQHLVSTLRRQGFDVIAASDGVEAVELHRKHQGQIQLVIVDVSLPRLNGADVLRAIHQREPNLLALVAVATPEEASRARAGRATALPTLQKPFTLKELTDAVSRLMGPTRPSA